MPKENIESSFSAANAELSACGGFPFSFLARASYVLMFASAWSAVGGFHQMLIRCLVYKEGFAWGEQRLLSQEQVCGRKRHPQADVSLPKTTGISGIRGRFRTGPGRELRGQSF